MSFNNSNTFSYAKALTNGIATASAKPAAAPKIIGGMVFKKREPKVVVVEAPACDDSSVDDDFLTAPLAAEVDEDFSTKNVLAELDLDAFPVPPARLTISTSEATFESAIAELDLKSPGSASTASCSSPVKSFDFDWANDDLDDLDWNEDRDEDNLRIDTKTGALITASEFAATVKASEPVYEWGDHLRFRYMPTIYEAEEPEEAPRQPYKPFVATLSAEEEEDLEDDASTLRASPSAIVEALLALDAVLLDFATISSDLFTSLSNFEMATLELAPLSPSIFATLSNFEFATAALATISPSVFSQLSNFEVATLELAPIQPEIFSEPSAFEVATSKRSTCRLQQHLEATQLTLDGYKAACRLDVARLYRAALQNLARGVPAVEEELESFTGVAQEDFYACVGPRIHAQVGALVLRLEHSRVANRRGANWMINDPWPLYHARNAPRPSAIRPPPGLVAIRPPPGLGWPVVAATDSFSFDDALFNPCLDHSGNEINQAPAQPRTLLPPPGLGAPVLRADVGDLYLNDLDSPAPQAPLKLETDSDWECADLDTVRAIFPLIQDVPGPGERFANYRRNSADACRFDHTPAPAPQYNLVKKQRGFAISAARFNYNSKWAAPEYKEPVVVPGADDDSFLDDLSCKPDSLRSISRASSVTAISESSALSAPSSASSGIGLGHYSAKVLSTLAKPKPAPLSWRSLKRSARGAFAAISGAL